MSNTETLVEMRGSTMSPDSSRPSASQYSAACSGEWPVPMITRQSRPPIRRIFVVADAPERQRHRRHQRAEVAGAARADRLQGRPGGTPWRRKWRRRTRRRRPAAPPTAPAPSRTRPASSTAAPRSAAAARAPMPTWSGWVCVHSTRTIGRPSSPSPISRVPEPAHLVRGDAAVDQGPALAVEVVAQQPEVDVIEREGQRHADPVHAGRDLHAGRGGRQGVAERIVELAFEGIHWR